VPPRSRVLAEARILEHGHAGDALHVD
jgi:hypothetical protein